MTDENTAEKAKFVLVPGSAENAPVYFFDGVAGIALGPSVCRMQFHQVVAPSSAEKAEVRKVIVNAVIPTAALVELCVNTLAAISNNAPALKNVMDLQSEQMFSSLPKSTKPKDGSRASKK